MVLEDQKSFILEYMEKVWNKADSVAFDELTSEMYTYHLSGQPPCDKTAMQQFLKAVHGAFPDWHFQIEDIISDGNTVVARWIGAATHQGVFHGILPTGKQISVCGINIYKIEGDKIIIINFVTLLRRMKKLSKNSAFRRTIQLLILAVEREHLPYTHHNNVQRFLPSTSHLSCWITQNGKPKSRVLIILYSPMVDFSHITIKMLPWMQFQRVWHFTIYLIFGNRRPFADFTGC